MKEQAREWARKRVWVRALAQERVHVQAQERMKVQGRVWARR